ncbi:dipeptidyl aminopeptidase/acylaminoacyl peptidase [Erythromicrobium ramosum]|uniref:Alpha/beta fold hydrolase n=1 Tax=Erythrobacter ramosus TaxID=35811 RepID=A0A6I4UJF6_9SPHN|nr:alpha/beta fold hydrolase [Erythrobacter ramosus]MBB3775660.1 dipeptidyl aminopeptidase/acylaminoacyl peptidase [Erythrobacter ramosus]MXP39241.1 alpha/beta fold hydrolase [Erythrobacter ramosus]
MLASGIGGAAQEPAPTPVAAATDARAPLELPPPQIAIKDFAGRSAFWDGKLSPDGSKFSYLRRKDGNTQFIIADVSTRKLVHAFGTDPSDQFEWYNWVSDDKLLFSVSTAGTFMGEDVRYTRLILVDVTTGVMSPLFGRTNVVEGDNVIHYAEDGSYILVSIQKTIYDYPSVMRHELMPDGKVTTVQQPRDGVWNWTADNNGVVRMGAGWLDGRLKVYYRSDATGELKLVARVKESEKTTDRYWDAVQILGGSDEGYVLSEGETGRVGLRRYNFATREMLETIYEHPEWDIDSVGLKDGQPYAAYYTADRDEVHYFDPAVRKQHAALRKALGDVEVWVPSRAKDGSRMLVYAGNEADPGVLYMYEPAGKILKEMAQYRPTLDFQALASPKPMQYTARDGAVIRGYLTLPRGREAKGLPLIIMPHGGPYGIRDKLTYNDEVQLLANRGYAVLQPNFRGSGGYGEAFFELGTGQIGRMMQDDLDDAMDWAVKEGIADPARVCVVGGSYGGYAAMWAVLRNPERYRCAASWAGVTDLEKQLRYDSQSFSRGGYKRWRDRVRGQGVAEVKTVSPMGHAAKLNRPLLLAHGTKDIVVPFSQYNMFEKATREAPMRPQTLVIKDEGHSFSTSENEQQWYEALTGFLAKHNPPDPAPVTVAAASAP